MSLYRRKGGRIWYCEWEIGGKRVRETTGTADRQEAQEYHDRRRAALWREARLGDTPAIEWDAAALSWVDEHAVHKASFETDRLRLRWLHPHLTGRQIESITTELLLDIRKRRDGSNATKNRHLAVVSAVLHHARAKGCIHAIPKIPYLPEPKQRIRWITKDQARRLIEELPDHLAAMARFALATGLRRANVTGLTWENVDVDRRVAWIWGDEAKAGKPISVPLNDDATAVLREQQVALRRRQEEEPNRLDKGARYVFVWRNEPVRETNTRAFKQACARAGIEAFNWHDFRHTWASWHVMAGTPLDVLRQLGGWADMTMVLRYAHLAPGYIAGYAGNVSLSVSPSPVDDVGEDFEENAGLVGWPMGLEPTTTGITIPQKKKKRA